MPDLSHRCTSPAHIVVAALGLGLLFGLMWSSRNVNSDVEEWQVFVTRFASMAVFLVVAVVSRRDPQSEKALMLTGLGCLLGRLACDGVSLALTGVSETLALGAVGSVCEGAALALFQLLFLKCIIHFELRRGIIAIGVAYFVAELVYSLLLFVPLYGVAAVLRIGEVVGFILLVWLRYQASEPAGAPCEQGSLSSSVFGGAPLPAALAFIVCLTLSWGLFAQMTGDGAAAFFDATSEIVMVAVRALLLIACLAVGTKVRFSNLAPLCAALWTLGILAVGLLWGSVAVSASALIIKAGLYALQEFSLIVLTADAHERPRCFMFNAGLVLCALMSAHISRLIVLAMHGNSPVLGNDAIALIAVASGLVVAALLVVNRVETARVLCGPRGLGDAADGPVDATARRSVEFSRRFEDFCDTYNLPEREREVLLETLHGYTVDGVADRVGLSRETVKTYLSRTYSRAGVAGRQELLAVLDADAAEPVQGSASEK